MAELALAISILEVVKLTYHVAEFVYKTIKSAKSEDAEQGKIASEFGRELLFLASFERYLEKTHGAIAYDKKLDEVSHWEGPKCSSSCLRNYLHGVTACSYGFPISNKLSAT